MLFAGSPRFDKERAMPSFVCPICKLLVQSDKSGRARKYHQECLKVWRGQHMQGSQKGMPRRFYCKDEETFRLAGLGREWVG